MRTKFLRSEAGKRKRLAMVWRRPRGQSNKLRRGEKCRGPKPKIGLKKPGKETPERIFSLEALKFTKAKEIIIGSGIGRLKKARIAEEAKKRNIKVLNKPKKIKVKKAETKEAKK